MRSSGIRVGSKCKDKYPYKRQKRDRYRCRGEGHAKTEAAFGTMHLQVKECRGLTAGSPWEKRHGPPEASALPTSGFGLLPSRTVKE